MVLEKRPCRRLTNLSQTHTDTHKHTHTERHTHTHIYYSNFNRSKKKPSIGSIPLLVLDKASSPLGKVVSPVCSQWSVHMRCVVAKQLSGVWAHLDRPAQRNPGLKRCKMVQNWLQKHTTLAPRVGPKIGCGQGQNYLTSSTKSEALSGRKSIH